MKTPEQPDILRHRFEANGRKKTSPDKRCSMREAVAEAVRTGDSLVIEGFTHLICFAAGHEIIRQGIRNLVGIRLTPDLIYDQMIQAGCFRKLIFSWAGNPGVGSLHALRRHSQKDSPERIEIEEYSHFGMVGRLSAGSSGLPFWPMVNYEGSNIADVNPLIRTVACPYTERTVTTVPALNPDVAVIHCQRCDRQGNAQVWGLLGTQKESAFAARRVIIVAEEIVDTAVIRSDPNRTLIPGILVDHVVHEPWGCHPSFAQGHYDRDNQFYIGWDQISRDEQRLNDYLAEYVYGVRNRKEYMRKQDSDLIARLKASPRICKGVDYGY